ncbi:MAG: NUDIX domain-containing protein [Nitrososphaeraceae archaeon]
MKKIELMHEESVGVVLAYKPSSTSFNSENANNEYFLLLKSPRGAWNFVKGHREENESDYDTLRREIFEETGISDYKILSYLDKIEYEFRKNGVEVKKEVKFYYANTATYNVLLSKEHMDYIWLKYRQAKRLISFYESKLLLEKVFVSGLSY